MHTVVVESKGFWFFKHWRIWDTRNPRVLVEAWTREEANFISNRFAGNDGNIAILDKGKLTPIFSL